MGTGDTVLPNGGSDDGPLVLLVDDEVPLVEALAQIVADAGFRPLIAMNGKQGLDFARVRHPSLIFTDLMMPQLDGVGLIAALRQDAAQHDQHVPPIIVMTAGGLKHAREIGADAVLRKPFTITDIEALLQRYLLGAHDATRP